MKIEGLDKLGDNLESLVQKGVDELNKGLDRINNGTTGSSQSASKVPTQCPNCAAPLNANLSPDHPYIICEYCGTRFDNIQTKSVVDSVFDFVEKQQKVASENMARKAEIRAEMEARHEIARAEARRRARPRKIIRTIIFLAVIVGFAYYYVQNKAMVDAAVMPVIQQVMDGVK